MMNSKGKQSLEFKLKVSKIHKGKVVSDETKEKIRQAWERRKARQPEMSEETKQKIGKANRGKKRTLETRLKMQEAALGRPSPTKGMKMPEEQKAKISEALKGRKISEAELSRRQQGRLAKKAEKLEQLKGEQK
jgi:hypothetical protein